MKKVKIMLMSIAVLAIVGGALAFKATKFQQTFCYLTAKFDNGTLQEYYCPGDPRWELVDNRTTCETTIPAVTDVPNGQPLNTTSCTTIRIGEENCQTKECDITATLFDDGI